MRPALKNGVHKKILLLLLAFAILERRRTAGAIDVFEPIVIFVLSWGLFFVARPIAMLLADDFSLGPLDARPAAA